MNSKLSPIHAMGWVGNGWATVSVIGSEDSLKSSDPAGYKQYHIRTKKGKPVKIPVLSQTGVPVYCHVNPNPSKIVNSGRQSYSRIYMKNEGIGIAKTSLIKKNKI